MKILFITDLYPVKNEEKTTPRTLLNFVRGWRNSGVEVDVLKPNFLLNSFVRRKPFYSTGLYENVYNVNYYSPFLGDVKQKLKGYSFTSYDIVVAHMPSGILFADKLGLPFIAGIHNSDLEILTNPLYSIHFKKRELVALEHSRAIACRSYVIMNKFLEMFPQFSDKTFVAPSGIDEKYILNDFTHNINKENLKIVTCANFKKRKNIDKLIIALKDIADVELIIIGDGEGADKLKAINRNCIFLGRLPNESVFDVLKNSDIFILPSVNETFGMVYLEAMASGCISICTSNDGVDGIIKNGENGFTVEPNEESIKNIIKKIQDMDISELNIIRENSLKTIRQYTEKACCENYLSNIQKYM